MSQSDDLARSARQLDALMIVAGVLLLAAVLGISALAEDGRGEALTRNTVRLALAWYALALLGMLRLTAADWDASTRRGRFVRWCWTCGVVSFLVHLAMAFHYYHHWSHWHAFERTRQISGVGEGVYISYLFTWLWIADCVWWWLQPRTYASRSKWIGRSLHAFMLFIVFNSTVLFEAGGIRWAGLTGFAVLGAVWFLSSTHPKSAQA